MTPSSAGCLSVSQQNVSPPIDIKIVSLRPQTTDSQPPRENIFSANAKNIGEIRRMVKYNRREKVLILSFTLFQSLEFPSKFQISQQPNIQI